MNRRSWMAFTDWVRTLQSASSLALYNSPEIGTDGTLLTHANIMQSLVLFFLQKEKWAELLFLHWTQWPQSVLSVTHFYDGFAPPSHQWISLSLGFMQEMCEKIKILICTSCPDADTTSPFQSGSCGVTVIVVCKVGVGGDEGVRRWHWLTRCTGDSRRAVYRAVAALWLIPIKHHVSPICHWPNPVP